MCSYSIRSKVYNLINFLSGKFINRRSRLFISKKVCRYNENHVVFIFFWNLHSNRYIKLSISKVGPIFSMIGLILYYYIDMYNLLRRRTIKENISQELSLGKKILDFKFKQWLICFNMLSFLILLED